MWNVQGISNGVHGFKLNVPEVRTDLQKYDIIGLVETHANDTINVELDGYITVAQVNRPKLRTAKRDSGGLAALIRKELAKGISYIQSPNLPECLIWLKLAKSFFKWQDDLYLAIIYLSPEYSTLTVRDNPDLFEKLESDIAWFSQKGKILLTGDFNARTGAELDYIEDDDNAYLPMPNDYVPDRPQRKRVNQDKVCRRYGRALLDLCKSCGLRILNGRTIGDSLGNLTCHQYNGSSTVDYGIVHFSILPYINYFKVHKWFESVSDHSHISFSISAHFTKKPEADKINLKVLKNQYKWDKESGYKFLRALSSPGILSRLQNINDSEKLHNVNPELLLDQITNVIHEVADQSLRKKKLRNNKVVRQKWFDLPCVHYKKECRLLGELLQKQPFNRGIREQLFSTKKKYKSLVRQKKREYKNTILKNIENLHCRNPSSYWKLVDELRNIQANPTKPETISPGEWFKYFKNLFAKAPNTDPAFEEEISNAISILEKQVIFNELNYTIKESEIIKVLKNLKTGKAVGSDGIANEMLKTGVSELSKPLTVIFNKKFTSGNYPKKWGEGLISTIFKSGDRSQPGNHRGITLCSNLAKVYSMVLNERLAKFIERKKIGTKEQIAFQKKTRTSDHMFTLKSLIDVYTKKNGKLFACFVDLRKAFDQVWWNGLFYKILNLEIGGNFYSTIKNMYKSVSSCVKTKFGITPAFNIFQGVRQGEVLSPSLFSLYINDLPMEVGKDHRDAVSLGKCTIQCLLYADDIVLLSTTKEGLQKCLNNLENYCNRWKLQINFSKTKVIIFNRTGRLLRDHFVVGGNPIECVKTYKYLGLIFCNSGSFNMAISNLKVKAMKASFKLKKIIDANHLSPKVAMSLFNSLIKPIVLYGADIWGTTLCAPTMAKMFKKFNDSPIEKVQLSFARFALGVHKHASSAAIYGELGILPLAVAALKCTHKFKEHITARPKDTLLGLAVIECRETNAVSWWTAVHKQEQFLHCVNLHSKDMMKKYKILYTEHWSKLINDSKSKLRTYAKFKTCLQFENYLNEIPFGPHRHALTKLRTSSHNLCVETGRYARPKVAFEDRLCVQCNRVEDECHFLINCPLYSNERAELFQKVEMLCPNFTALNDDNKFIFLMTAEKEIACATGKFCFLAFEKRKSILYPEPGSTPI